MQPGSAGCCGVRIAMSLSKVEQLKAEFNRYVHFGDERGIPERSQDGRFLHLVIPGADGFHLLDQGVREAAERFCRDKAPRLVRTVKHDPRNRDPLNDHFAPCTISSIELRHLLNHVFTDPDVANCVARTMLGAAATRDTRAVMTGAIGTYIDPTLASLIPSLFAYYVVSPERLMNAYTHCLLVELVKDSPLRNVPYMGMTVSSGLLLVNLYFTLIFLNGNMQAVVRRLLRPQ